MSVLDFYNCYRNLRVDLINSFSILGLDVHEYRNAKDFFAEEPSNRVSEDHEVTVGMNVWGKMQGRIKKKGTQIGTHRYQIDFEKEFGDGRIRLHREMVAYSTVGPSFYGKGSPEGISQALRLAVALEMTDATHAALQKFCDENIGLDCSGFVGNYLRHKGLGPDLGPSSKVSAFAPPAYRVKELSDIRAESVIVWESGSHVAIVDRVDRTMGKMDGTVHAWVAESTGSQRIGGRAGANTDGMQYTKYIFRSVSKQVFKVLRGIRDDGSTSVNSVYVANF
jgi:hypothetical protein